MKTLMSGQKYSSLNLKVTEDEAPRFLFKINNKL